MLQAIKTLFGSLVFVATLVTSNPLEARQQPVLQVEPNGRVVVQRRIPPAARSGALAFVRTELFFGTAKPDGVVSEEEFLDFVDRVVTPRFPDGLTILRADGQFRGENDVVVKEDAFVLILLYPYDSQRASSRRVDTIRERYKDEFAQQSVLRVDDPYIVWVSF